MTFPCLTIDLNKIEHNARVITGLCGKYGIEVTGVTKVACGHPEIAKAMLRGGVMSIADSRLENIRRLQKGGVDEADLLLRLPSVSRATEVVEAVRCSLNSELAVLEALSQAAVRLGKVHEVVLMVDLGDLREGIWPDDLIPVVKAALELPGIEIIGLGTNLACFGGVVPSVENMNRLVALAEDVEQILQRKLRWVSGINSSGLDLIAAGRMPPRVNHARIGEAILLGCETTHRRPWPGTFQDAFILRAEILELKRKPSLPIGERAEDAFGHIPAFEDRGVMPRALLNIGREDVTIEGVRPLDSRLRILGGSSGYLVVDLGDAPDDYQVGDTLAFSLNYSALLMAMTSEYVAKSFVENAVKGG